MVLRVSTSKTSSSGASQVFMSTRTIYQVFMLLLHISRYNNTFTICCCCSRIIVYMVEFKWWWYVIGCWGGRSIFPWWCRLLFSTLLCDGISCVFLRCCGAVYGSVVAVGLFKNVETIALGVIRHWIIYKWNSAAASHLGFPSWRRFSSSSKDFNDMRKYF